MEINHVAEPDASSAPGRTIQASLAIDNNALMLEQAYGDHRGQTGGRYHPKVEPQASVGREAGGDLENVGDESGLPHEG